MRKKRKTLSLNIFSLISLLLAVVTIAFFAFSFLKSSFGFLSGVASANGFDFVIYPFQKLFGTQSQNTLIKYLDSISKTNTLGLLLGIFADFALLFAALYLILSVLRIAGLINAKRNTLPLMMLISMVFLFAALCCSFSLISELKVGSAAPVTQIYLPLGASVLAVVASLVRK